MTPSSPLMLRGDGSDNAYCTRQRLLCAVVSSALFVPRSASWFPLSSPLQPPRQLFLTPPFLLHLAVAPESIYFPLPGLSLTWLAPDFDLASGFGCRSESPRDLATTLFAGFRHGPSDVTHKLALQFTCASDLFQFVETAASFGAGLSPRLTNYLAHFLSSDPSDRNLHAYLNVNPENRDLESDLEPLSSSGCTAVCAPLQTGDDCHAASRGTGRSLSNDSHSGNLRRELLACLLDASFRRLVERMEDFLIEIENPENIDLEVVEHFLTMLK